ncbi:MAG: hypothetical protein LC104_17715 [Bacteroidales bacterium]|nr:hypothetical protein [Bacteroidales bacterium]
MIRLTTLFLIGGIALSLLPSAIQAEESRDFPRKSVEELNALFAAGSLATMPHRFIPGTAIFHAGTQKAVRKARRIGLVWKGKVFTPDGMMINRLPGGAEMIRAKVFLTESWFDGQPTLVFDYCETSKLFRHVRDEVREIGPGLYLGVTYLRQPCGPPKFSNFFILDDRRGCRECR